MSFLRDSNRDPDDTIHELELIWTWEELLHRSMRWAGNKKRDVVVVAACAGAGGALISGFYEKSFLRKKCPRTWEKLLPAAAAKAYSFSIFWISLQEAYIFWICSTQLPMWLLNPQTHKSEQVGACQSNCLTVEKRCPFLIKGTEDDMASGNPSFMCKGKELNTHTRKNFPISEDFVNALFITLTFLSMHVIPLLLLKINLVFKPSSLKNVLHTSRDVFSIHSRFTQDVLLIRPGWCFFVDGVLFVS